MTSFEWFEVGVCTGLVTACIAFRLGRWRRDNSQPMKGDA